jgi:hypothetical protein
MIRVDRESFISAFNSLEFSTHNSATSSFRLEVVSKEKLRIYSCTGIYANVAYVPIVETDQEKFEDLCVIISSNGITPFLSSIPSKTVTFQSVKDKIKVVGSWEEDWKENYTEQSFSTMGVNIPNPDKLMGNCTEIGSVNAHVLLEGFKYLKGMVSRDIGEVPLIGVVDGNLVLRDPTKISIFQADLKIPNLSCSHQDLSVLISFLNQYKTSDIMVKGLNKNKGYILEASDGSALIYSINPVDLGTDNSIEFGDGLAAIFEIDAKKLTNSLKVLKTPGSSLYDEMQLRLSQDGILNLVEKTSHDYEAKLTVNPIRVPAENIEINLKFSKVLNVLTPFDAGQIRIGIDIGKRRLLICQKTEVTKVGDTTIHGEISTAIGYWPVEA